jgi:hypothetical protein
VHVAQLRDREREFERRNVRLAAVTFQAENLARAYVVETGLAWPLLVDDTRETYRNYGMLSASFRDVWGPKTWRAYWKALVAGKRFRRSGGDIYQRGGDVLIDPCGTVVLHHVGAGPADRPGVDRILARIPPA